MAQKKQNKTEARRMTRMLPRNSEAQNSERFQENQWKTYNELQKKVDESWAKLKYDMDHGASTDVIWEHKNNLLLLLGECDYMTRQYMKLQNLHKKAV